MSEFVLQLKNLARSCEFGDFLDQALRDRIVAGLRCADTQRELFAADADTLTFGGACKIALNRELASNKSQQIKFDEDSRRGNLITEGHQINKISGQAPRHVASNRRRGVRAEQFECFRCGNNHSERTSRYRRYKCHSCGKQGHLRTMCKQGAQPRDELNCVDDSAEESLEEFQICSVASNKAAYYVTMEEEGHNVTMELDTGASVTVVPKAVYQQKWAHLPLQAVAQPKRTLRKQPLHDGASGTHRTLRERLEHFLLAYRTTPCTVTGRSPAELFLKRAPRTKLSLLKPSFQKDMEKVQHKAKSHIDRHRSAFRFFTEGDKVYVKTVRGEKVSWTEGLVVEVISPVTYLVNTGGKVHFVHVDHMRVASYSQPADVPTPRQSPYPVNAETLPSGVPRQVPMAVSASTEVCRAPVSDGTMQGDHPAIESGGHRQRNPGEEPTVQPPVPTPEGSPRPALLHPTPSGDPTALRRSSRRRQQTDRYQSEDFRNRT